MNWLPAALLAVPLLGALPVLSPALRTSLRLYGLIVSGVVLALAVVMVAAFDYGQAARMQFTLDLPWIPGLGIRFHLGVDGISLPLIALTALLTFLCFAYLCVGGGRLLRSRPRALVFTLLVLEVGMIGTFLALDLLLFFVFFEIVLIPMYFLIAVWGGQARRAAAFKFILYTLLGSVVMLLGLLYLWAQTGTLDIVELAAQHGAGMPRAVQTTAFIAIAIGLAVKTPMWPLHTWLPDAHTEAPTVGSVLLAGVLLKMGTYGFARIAIPVLPEGAAAVAPWLGVFAVVGIIYGALACLAQRDLKRMIAYSSVGHMGFVLLGFATLTTVGINGALFANVAHGLITGLLFFAAGAIKERYGTVDMSAIGGGMLATVPRLGSVLTFAAVASLGLPGLAGFWGEMLALLGAFQPAEILPRGLFLVYMVIGGLGAVLTAAYFLLMLSRVTHGVPSRPETVTVGATGPAGAGERLAPGRAGVGEGAVGDRPEVRAGEEPGPAMAGGREGASPGVDEEAGGTVRDVSASSSAGTARATSASTPDGAGETTSASSSSGAGGDLPAGSGVGAGGGFPAGSGVGAGGGFPAGSGVGAGGGFPAGSRAGAADDLPARSRVGAGGDLPAGSSAVSRAEVSARLPAGEHGPAEEHGPAGPEGTGGASGNDHSMADQRLDVGEAGNRPDAGEAAVGGEAGDERLAVAVSDRVGGRLPDIRGYELVAWVPLIALTLLFGLWPKLLLSLTTPAVQALLGVGP
ncbi:NADH-quinone oxidoreductase subunit M [Nonomuraea longicatena]|uniref:NADH:quinone oxidoreductase/Mrp antiporter transmembrane domain-containing protein n=1 Tax=Nonomuraea longicatena TaxID=83682 RepID=A0ABP4APR5_9ACTN